MSWENVLGRVSFINCDPVFHSIGEEWKVLAAPPSWLTGHLLRRDCITAPIPTADFALHHDELVLLPNIGIVGREKVGSVLLFGNRDLDSMRDIALPSDSSTSRMLMQWILKNRRLDPRFVEMGPDIDSMLERCDGALIIGDRAISASLQYPDLVKMDLGREWSELTGFPMVFGVFAARKDSPQKKVIEACNVMINQYEQFLSDNDVKSSVIASASKKVGLTVRRVEEYFESEVSNKLENDSIRGLNHFLETVYDISSEDSWLGVKNHE
ncbi:MAG: hypothetical protein CMB61_01150 [Euryarchaeota archaeon]|nr:hypothetical protein [Euryarchaeota archaeon]